MRPSSLARAAAPVLPLPKPQLAQTTPLRLVTMRHPAFPPHHPPSRSYPHAPRVNPHAEEKIARVSGADLDLFEHSLTLEIRGSEDERNRAKKYVECVMAQRVGPVHIEEDDGDDLTTIMVPSEAVGFVTGSQVRP